MWKVETGGSRSGMTSVKSHRTCVCPRKHYLEVLPRLLPPTLLALNSSQLCRSTPLSAPHNCISGQFVIALLLHHSSSFPSRHTKSNSYWSFFMQNYSPSARLALSLCLSFSLSVEEVAVVPGSWRYRALELGCGNVAPRKGVNSFTLLGRFLRLLIGGVEVSSKKE